MISVTFDQWFRIKAGLPAPPYRRSGRAAAQPEPQVPMPAAYLLERWMDEQSGMNEQKGAKISKKGKNGWMDQRNFRYDFLTGNCEAHIIWENARFERIASILRVIIW